MYPTGLGFDSIGCFGLELKQTDGTAVPSRRREAEQTKQTKRAKKILVQPDYSIFLFRFEFLRQGYKKIKSKQHLEGEAGVTKAHTPSEKLFFAYK